MARPPHDWPALLDALHADDLDAAIEGGLLAWDGHADAPAAAGLAPADIAMMQRLRAERLAALDARERHRARAARLAAQQAAREARRRSTWIADPGKTPALTAAAAAALARALAKGGR